MLAIPKKKSKKAKLIKIKSRISASRNSPIFGSTVRVSRFLFLCIPVCLPVSLSVCLACQFHSPHKVPIHYLNLT